MSLQQSLADFTRYCRQHLRGDEKGEAQIFLDRLFSAFGFSEGLRGAGVMATKPSVAAHFRTGLVTEDCVRMG